jgi:RNA-binding protein 39
VPLANPSLSLPGPTVPGMSSLVAPLVPSLGPTTMSGYMGLHGSAVAVPAVAAPVMDPIGVPNDCLLLKNMFDPNNEVCESSFCLTGEFFTCHYLEIFFYLPKFSSKKQYLKLQTEPDFDLDIKEDVQDECSKFGAVRHIFVDK